MTQNEMILSHLLEGKTITPAQAYTDFGCLRLAGRIFELRKQGHNILTFHTHSNGKTFATYKLKEADSE
jgi:hypothetical protein